MSGAYSGSAELIAGAYALDASLALPGEGGGLPAFGVIDHRHGRRNLMAVRVETQAPARAQSLASLAGRQIDNLIGPVAHGVATGPDGRPAGHIICPRPPGRALDAAGLVPWSEAELLQCVLRPAALALDQLAQHGITHRAIRPNNLFRAGPGTAVTLGCAWAAPPASLQPALFEPPYVAMCHPAGRGEGSIADDVYALGVVLLTLAAGKPPLAELDEGAILRRKLERGSFAALVGDLRLPPMIVDLVRGMLAEDPEHRPPPLLLADPVAARSRRVAARPPPRAQRPLQVGDRLVWNARELACAMAADPDQATRLLRGLVVDGWLRRGLGDPMLAGTIGEIVQAEGGKDDGAARGDRLLVMQAVALLDPLAPLCWGGLVLFPDGLGPLLACLSDAASEPVLAMIQADAIANWADLRPERCDVAVLHLDSRQHRLVLRIPGWAGGLPRLRITLNPLLPCRSPLLQAFCVVRPGDLLPALERIAGSAGDLILDHEIGAFIAARLIGKLDADLVILSQQEDSDIDPPGHRGLAQLRVLASLQKRDPKLPVPALAELARRAATPALACWRHRATRAAREGALAREAAAGQLTGMLAVLDDPAARSADQQAALHAAGELRRLSALLDGVGAQEAARAARARSAGHEIAAALGIMAAVTAAVVTVLS